MIRKIKKKSDLISDWVKLPTRLRRNDDAKRLIECVCEVLMSSLDMSHPLYVEIIILSCTSTKSAVRGTAGTPAPELEHGLRLE